MLTHTDYTLDPTWDDVVKHRVRLPGYFNSSAAKFLYDKAPKEFDAEQVGVDGNGQYVYVLFWHPPVSIES